jgi:hypothetical protein
MKVWIVCDNNTKIQGIFLYTSYEKAQEHVSQYEYPQLDDCWIEDLDGTEVI